MGNLRTLVEEKFLLCLLVLFVSMVIIMNYNTLKNTLMTQSEVFINPFLIALCLMLILKVIFSVTACDKTNSTTIEFANIEKYNIPGNNGLTMAGGSKKYDNKRNRDIFLKNVSH